MSRRRIVVFTGTRAEYGLLRGVLAALAERADTELSLLVSGTHLSAAYGGTAAEIFSDNFGPARTVDIGLEDNSELGVARSMGRALSGYASALAETAPDLLLVLGDRYETFCAAAAATALRIPMGHIGGGETTEGAMDEAFRHAISKMSHLHFAACDDYRDRIVQMGEAPERAWTVGALGVENVHQLTRMDEREVRAALGVPEGRPYLVATFHPTTLEAGTAEGQLEWLLAALANLRGVATVFTGANADAGGGKLNEMLRRRAEGSGWLRFFPSLGVVRYVNAVRYASGVVGNSSSGVVEVPSLGIPVLDVGDRQKGRLRSSAVLHVAADPRAMAEGLERLLLPESGAKARSAPNPYDRPGTARAIAERAATYPLAGLLKKAFWRQGRGNCAER